MNTLISSYKHHLPDIRTCFQTLRNNKVGSHAVNLHTLLFYLPFFIGKLTSPVIYYIHYERTLRGWSGVAVKQVTPLTIFFVQLNSMFVPTLTVTPGTFSLFTGQLAARQHTQNPVLFPKKQPLHSCSSEPEQSRCTTGGCRC